MQVAWPISNTPGQKPQEGAGRLINVFAEPRGEGLGPVWRRVPGAAVFARSPSAGSAAGHATALGVSSVVAVQGLADGHATAEAVGSAA
jgi:hypothetical protein